MPKVLNERYVCPKCRKDFGNRKSNYDFHINRKISCVTKEIENIMIENRILKEKEPKNNGELYVLLKNMNLEQFKEWFVIKSSFEKMEACLRLFGALKLFPQLVNYNYCLGNFNNHSINDLNENNMSLFMNEGLTRPGDSCDAVFQNETTILGFTSKNYSKNLHVGDLEISKIKDNYQGYTKQLKIGICCRDKIELLNTAKSAKETSKIYSQDILNATILDYNDIVYAFSILKDNYRDYTITKKPITPYFHQKLLKEKICQILQTESLGAKLVVCGAVCRSGKSYIMALLAKEYNNTVIITLRPSETIKDLTILFENHNFEEYNIITLTGSTKKPKLEDKNIIIVSKQFLQGKIDYESNDKIKTITWLKEMKKDIILIDEPHDGGSTELSKKIYNLYCNDTKTVYITGTYNKPVIAFNINDKNIVTWNMEDIRICRNIDESGKSYLREKYGEKIINDILSIYSDSIISETYSRYPELVFVKTNFKSNIKKEILTTDFGWSIKALLQLHDNGKFKEEKEVVKLLFSIFGRCKMNHENIIVPDRSSVLFQIEEYCNKCETRYFSIQDPLVVLIFLEPNNIDQTSNALVKLIEKNDIASNFELACINGYTCKGKTSIEMVDISIQKAKNNGKSGVIIFAGKMLNAGATIKKCDIVFMLNDTHSYDMYYQMIFRCMTEDNNKKLGFVWDFNNQRDIRFFYDLATTIYNQEKDGKKTIEYLLDRKIVHLIGSEWYKENFDTKQPSTKQIANYVYNEYIQDTIATKKIIDDLKNYVVLNAKYIEQLNKIFENKYRKISKSSECTNQEIKGEDRDIPNGVENSRCGTKCVNETVNEEEEKKENKNLFRDIFPYTVVYLSLFTLDSNSYLFTDMCNQVINNSVYRQIVISQMRTCWGDKIPDNIFEILIKVYNEFMADNRELEDKIRFVKERIQAVKTDSKKLYEIIEDYLLPQDNEKRINAEISTPLNIRKEMLDSLPKNTWTKKISIYEPTCGKGGFLIDIIDRFMDGLKDEITDREQRYKFIVEKMLFFGDINSMNIYICKLLLDPDNKYKLNYYQGDTLKINISETFGKQKFKIIVGNPPYSTDPSKPDTKPLYNLFIEKYIDLCDYFLFITPSRWFAGGKGLDKFRKFMLSRKDIAFIKHYQNSVDCFKNVNIEGGVNYFLKKPFVCDCMFNDQKINLNSYDILVEPKYIDILNKVQNYKSIEDIYMNRGYFKIETNDKRLHDDSEDEKSITCYVSSLKCKDRKKYICSKYINNIKNSWKVITSEANGNKKCFGYMQISDPNSVYTNSYIGFRVNNEFEAKNLISYLKCKLPNFLLGIRKISQHISTTTIKWIPIVPLDREWDDKSVSEYFQIDF